MPPLPKNPATRQRRNRTSTAATLPAGPSGVKRPPLPERSTVADGQQVSLPWHPSVTAAWRDWWESPMAREWIEADVHGLFLLAELLQMFYEKPSAALAGEIRQQRMAFGLTPIDRRRLQWEVQRAEDATERGRRRRPSSAPAEEVPAVDVRAALHAV